LLGFDLVPQFGDGDVSLRGNLRQKVGLRGFAQPTRHPVTRLRTANRTATPLPLPTDLAHIFKTHAKSPRKLTARPFAALISHGNPHP
jgi:hypothetical protein